MKYFILAGEKSGDLHGSNLVKSIFKQDPNAIIKSWGGDEMIVAGAEVLVHHRDLSIMGIIGVLKNLVRLKRLFKLFEHQISEFHPDTIIFIDYGGFNLKAAKIAKLARFHTQFYIAPKVWAWNYSRVKTIKKWIDELYVIFPFEKKLFESEGIHTHYEGNPIMDEIASFHKDESFKITNNLPANYIALLPGSRKQEINSLLPLFLNLMKANPSYQFVIAGVEEFKGEFEQSGIPVIYQNTYQVLANSQMAIVCSGTATLETALLNIPLVVVYKTDPIFYFLAKTFIKIKYISLVNIILNKLAIPELIQQELTVTNLTNEIKYLFEHDQLRRITQLENFKQLRELIGEKGASDRVAQLMIEKAKLFSNN